MFPGLSLHRALSQQGDDCWEIKTRQECPEKHNVRTTEMQHTRAEEAEVCELRCTGSGFVNCDRQTDRSIFQASLFMLKGFLVWLTEVIRHHEHKRDSAERKKQAAQIWLVITR